MLKLNVINNRFITLIEDLIFSAPLPWHRSKFSFDEEIIKVKLTELRSFGYTTLGQLLSADQVIALRELIDQAALDASSKLNVDYSSDVKYWAIRNPLKIHKIVVDLAMNELCLALAERYFSRTPYLTDVDARKILPIEMSDVRSTGNSSSDWHRDTRGRQLKMMVYLSNVNSSDSNFSFFPETHKKNYIRNTYAQSRFSEEDIKRIQKEPVEWYGEMGEAMLFDTNIIHRLRRKQTATPRYSLTYYYTPGQCARELEYFEKDLGEDCKKNSIFSNPIWPFKRI